MSRLLIVLLWMGTAPLVAQQRTTPGWDQVLQITPGADITVRVLPGTIHCRFAGADQASLTCVRRLGPFGTSRSRSFDRTDIVSVKGTRKLASTAAGGAIGTGVGLAIGEGIDASERGGDDPHLAAAIFGFLGGTAGLLVGHASDFLAGPVIYRHP